MVMWQDPSQQAAYEEQLRRERERLLAEQEAAAAKAKAAQTTPQTTQPAQTTTPTQTTATTNTASPNQPLPPPPAPVAPPPAGYYIDGYVNGQPVYKPINPGSGSPTISPGSPDYPTQPVLPEQPKPTTPPETVYYDDKDEWEKAGSPTSDATRDVIIGTPPKPGEPTTGVFVKDPETGKTTVVPFDKYDPTTAPGYKPTDSMLNQQINKYEVESTAYSTALAAFDEKWNDKIKDGEFTGTEAEWNEYNKEIEELKGRGEHLDRRYQSISDQSRKLKDQQAAEMAEFARDNVRLSDGKYINKADLEKLRQENPAAYQIIMKGGITGYDNFMAEYNEASAEKKYNMMVDAGFVEKGSRYVGEDEAGNPLFLSGKQVNVMDTLKKYGDSPALALSKGALSTDQLKDIGYNDEQIQRFVDAVAEAKSSHIALPGESAFKQQWNRDYAKAEAAFNEAADRIEAENPRASKEEIAALLVNTPEYQALQELNEQIPDPMGTEFAIAHRAVVSGGSMLVFSPARSLLPEVKVEDISGMEWAIGGAQVALLTVPVLGVASKGVTGGAAIALRETEFALQAGAAAVFTQDTIDNWDYLKEHPWQAGLAIAMDGLIIASAAGALTKTAATVRAQQIANIEKQARKIVVDKFMDSATGRIDPRVKKTFTNIPTAPLEPGKYLPVKSEIRLPSLKTTMEDVARAIRTRDTALLKDAGRRMQYLALKDPSSPMAKQLEWKGKHLVDNADDYIKLADKDVPPGERGALDDAIKANQNKADEIERALKRGIKNPETRKIAEETLRETKRQIRTQVKERTATPTKPFEKVIMPGEQGKQVPAIKKGTELTTKERTKTPSAPREDPRIKAKPTADTDVMVTIKAGEGADVYIGYVSFPTSDPDSQRRYLEALKNTYTRQGYIVEVTPNEDIESEVLPGYGLSGTSGKTGTGVTKKVGSDTDKTTPGISPSDTPKSTPTPAPRTTPVPRNVPTPTPKTPPYTKPAEKNEFQPKPVPKPQPQPETPNPVTKPTPTEPKPIPGITVKVKTNYRRRGKDRDETDKEKRKRIAEADTKAGWIQGELKSGVVSHVVAGKNGQYEHIVVTGAVPEGVPMAKGKGQAYNSITLTHGIPPSHPVELEGGAVDPIVSPTPDKKGVTIRFVKDTDIKRRERKEKDKMFTINRRSARSGRSYDLGADIVKDRSGRHLRL